MTTFKMIFEKSTLTPLLLLSCAAMVGCATSGTKEDKEAQAKSQMYVDGTSYVSANGGKLTDRQACGLPANADKPFLSKDGGPSPDWKANVARANQCVVEKNWATLEKLAEVIARNDMNSPWGAYFYSVHAEATNQLPRALWMADLAQKKSGGRMGLFAYQKGRVLLQMKETKRAMAEVERGLGMEPRLAEGHLFLAEIYQRDLEFGRAETHYKAALDVDSKNYRALTGLAETKLEKEEGAAAVELYTKAAQAYPSQLRPWVRLAHIFETVQKDNVQALAAYKNLKSKLEAGSVKEKPDFDLAAKIKGLEEAVQPRLPAQAPKQASAKETDQTRSTK